LGQLRESKSIILKSQCLQLLGEYCNIGAIADIDPFGIFVSNPPPGAFRAHVLIHTIPNRFQI
jgi:hypothetical protein